MSDTNTKRSAYPPGVSRLPDLLYLLSSNSIYWGWGVVVVVEIRGGYVVKEVGGVG